MRRQMCMRTASLLLFVAAILTAQDHPIRQVPIDDAIRINEFYRLAAKLQENIWEGWSTVPAPLMLVTAEAEFLTRHPAPPAQFTKVDSGFYYRQRQFPTTFQATFPAFGFPPVIVIGEPANTASKSSAPWLFTVMHEHFHQLQWAQPGYMKAIDALDLSHGDTEAGHGIRARTA